MRAVLFITILLAGMAWAFESQAASTLTYTYDANGSMVSGEGKYYEYNDANQLVRVRQNNAAGAVLAEFFYDFNGQRVKKVENGVTTYYIGKHYETQVAGEGPGKTTTKASYYFANGERVAKKDSSGNIAYYHSDHLGGTNVVTDASGNLVERTKYYPFGEIREGGAEKYSYTGKEKDKQTDWHYYEARYYNPQFKHFTQADTVAPNIYDPQDLNRYAYVRNNPLKYIDPTGHFSLSALFRKIFGINTAIAPTDNNQQTTPNMTNVDSNSTNNSNNNSTLKVDTYNNLERLKNEYSDLKGNCKKFADALHKEEYGTNLPSIYQHNANGDINNVKAGDYIQHYQHSYKVNKNGKMVKVTEPYHTAKVLEVNEENKTMTVIDANWQSSKETPDIRIREDVPMSEFSDYSVY